MPASPDERLPQYLRELIHALNSPLGVLLGTAQFSLIGLRNKKAVDLADEDLAEIVESLEVIERQTRRCSGLVQEMRSLLLAGETEARPISLNQCLQQAVALIPWQSRGIEVLETREDAPAEIEGDEGKLVEAFGALARSAFDAMPQGGSLAIRVQTLSGRIEVVLEDTRAFGPEEDLSNFFSLALLDQEDPSVDLARAYLILRAHGAQLCVNPRPEGGMAVTVLFGNRPSVS